MAWPRLNIFSYYMYLIGSYSLVLRLLQDRIRSGWILSLMFIGYGFLMAISSSIFNIYSLLYPNIILNFGRFHYTFFLSQLLALPYLIFSHFHGLTGFYLLSYVLLCSKLNLFVVLGLITAVAIFCFLCYIFCSIITILYRINYNSFHHWRRVFTKLFWTRYHQINGSLGYYKVYSSFKDKRYFYFFWLQRIVLWLLVFVYIVPMFSYNCQFSFFLLDVYVDLSFFINPIRLLLYIIFFFRVYNNFCFLKDLYNSIKFNFYLLRLNAQKFDRKTTKVKGFKFYVLWFLSNFKLHKTGGNHWVINRPTRITVLASFGFCKIEGNDVHQTVIYSFDKCYLPKHWDKLLPEYTIYGLSFYNQDRSFVRNLDFDWKLFENLSFIDKTHQSNSRMFADWLFEWDSSTCTADPNLVSMEKYQELVERAAFRIAVHRHLTHIRNSGSMFRKAVKEYVQNVSLITDSGRFLQDPATWSQFEPHASHMRRECFNYLFELAILRS